MYFIDVDFQNNQRLVTTDFKCIHDPRTFNSTEVFATYNAVLDHGINKAGTCSFTIPYNNPYINGVELYQLVRISREKNGRSEIEWVGRIISIDRDLYLNKTVTCEGTLSFLNDVVMDPVTLEHEVPLYWRLYYICGDYMSKCSIKRRIGVIVDDTINRRFGFQKYIQTIDRPTAYDEFFDIVNRVDHAIVMDYDIDGTASTINVCALPVDKKIDGVFTPQTIELRKNILDYVESQSLNQLYTRIYPIGKDGLTLDDGRNYVEDSYLIEKYGVIERVVSYENIEDPSELLDAAWEELYRYMHASVLSSIEVTAFDLSLLNNTDEPIKIGCSYLIKSPVHNMDGTFVCTNAYIDLGNPANSKYRFDNLTTKPSPDYDYLTYQTSTYESKRVNTQPQKPVKITKESDNKVVQEFDDYSVIIEAEGTGKERYNFTRTIVGTTHPYDPE